jgi:hypothetical protein
MSTDTVSSRGRVLYRHQGLNADRELCRSATSTSARPVPSSVTAPGSCTSHLPAVHHEAQHLTYLPRYLLEHGLKADGRPDPDAKDLNEGGSFETFFTETGNGKYVPRSIFVDLDPSVRGMLRVTSIKLEAD